MAEPQIDVAAAQAALDAAGGMPDQIGTPPSDPWSAPRDDNGRFVASNTQADDATPDPADAAPEGDNSSDEIDFGSFTNVDVNALPPEMQQMQRSLQADYTRKMQEAAPWRKLGDELGLESPEDFRNAAQVYQQLQDPRNWPGIHGELSAYMQQYGMSPAQAQAAATDQLMNFAPDTPQQYAQSDYDYDPAEVDPTAPLVNMVQQLQQQVNALTQQTQMEKQQAAQQQQWNAVAQTLTANELEIRAQNPHYGDEEIGAIYNLMGPGGDLKAAQRQFESLIGAQVSKYIASKSGAANSAPPVVPGAGVLSTPQTERLTPDAAHRAAMAHVAALDREDATS
jgi:hypothetical protein